MEGMIRKEVVIDMSFSVACMLKDIIEREIERSEYDVLRQQWSDVRITLPQPFTMQIKE